MFIIKVPQERICLYSKQSLQGLQMLSSLKELKIRKPPSKPGIFTSEMASLSSSMWQIVKNLQIDSQTTVISSKKLNVCD